METKKIYVTSGAMRWVGHANGPLDAIKKALNSHGGCGAIDNTYIYLDERGFRHNLKAQYKVPVERALTEAGYIFEDERNLPDSLPSVEE